MLEQNSMKGCRRYSQSSARRERQNSTMPQRCNTSPGEEQSQVKNTTPKKDTYWNSCASLMHIVLVYEGRRHKKTTYHKW